METGKLSKYRLICFTDAGRMLMEKLAGMLEKESASGEDGSASAQFEKSGDAKAFVKSSFRQGNVLIFIGAAGIAVRLIAPFLGDKATDPAVIVIDECGDFVIPILSGHIGGGVAEARKIAALLGAAPVITTATDVRGVFAVDVFACENDLFISDMKRAKEFTAGLLKNGTASYRVDSRYKKYIDVVSMPDEIREIDAPDEHAGTGAKDTAGSDAHSGRPAANSFLISPGTGDGSILTLVPKCIVAGIGCRKGTDGERLHSFALECMERAGLSIRSLKAIASIDKKASEEGLCSLAQRLDVPFVTFSSEVLMAQEGEFASSQFVHSVTGTDNVCERAVMAYGCGELLVRKTARDGMTFAAGIMEIRI